MMRRTSAYTGSEMSVLTRTAMMICCSSSSETGALTPSRNWMIAIPIWATAVATAPAASGTSPWAGSRSSRRRPDQYPIAMYSSEVIPSVCTRIVSTSSPVANPMIAPVIEPVSRPTDITISGVRSALTPKIEICAIAVSWTTTVTSASAASRRTRRGETSLTGPGPARRSPGAG